MEQRGDFLQVGPGPCVALRLFADPFCHRPCGVGDSGTDPQAETAATRQAAAVCGDDGAGVVGVVPDFLSAGPGPQSHPGGDGNHHGGAADSHRGADGAPTLLAPDVRPGVGVGGADHGGLPRHRAVGDVPGWDALRFVGPGKHDLRLTGQCSLTP